MSSDGSGQPKSPTDGVAFSSLVGDEASRFIGCFAEDPPKYALVRVVMVYLII